VLAANDVIDFMRKPTLSSCTKQYSHRRRARSMTRRRADSSISRATDQDLSRAPFGHPKDVFQIDEMIQL